MDQFEPLLSKHKYRRSVGTIGDGISLLGFGLAASITLSVLCSPHPLQVIRAVVSPIFLAAIGVLIPAFFVGLWVGRRDFGLTPEQRARVAAGE